MNPDLLKTLLSIGRRQHSTLYLVGGPVRDGLLGRPCHDWDIACRHSEKVARAAARTLKGSFVVLDDRYKIYRVVLNTIPHPASSLLKREGTSLIPLPSRERLGEGWCSPVTLDIAEMQGKTIEEDLSRRDFTINAMAQRLDSSTIIDPCGGQRDLNRRLLRAASKKAFTEDPLRLLRAFRFAAQFHLKIEPKTLRWIREKPAMLKKMAAERIREEWLRLLGQPETSTWIQVMDHAGVLSLLFPEVESCRRTAVSFYGRGGVLKHSLQTVENLEWIFENFVFANAEVQTKWKEYLERPLGGYPRRSWLKWGGFLHDIGKPGTVQKIKGRLRFFGHEDVGADIAHQRLQDFRCSRQEIHDVSLWVRHHMRLGNLAAAPQATEKAIARYFRTLGDEGIGMLLVSLADHYCYLSPKLWGKQKDPVEKLMRRMMESYCLQREKMLPPRLVNGYELMKVLKIKPGPMVGKLLEAIQDGQADGKVQNKEEAVALARRVMKLH